MTERSLPEPKDNWRTSVNDALRAISPEVAEAFRVDFRKGGAVHAGLQALRRLSDTDRMAVWRTAFPAVADAIELAWHHHDPRVMARRDGDESGYGTRFTFAPTPSEADMSLIIWLRKLLLITGPYPDESLDVLLANLRRFKGNRFDPETYHAFDSDAPAYLASIVLTQQPESTLSARMADLLEDQLLGRKSGGCDRALSTAIFCADRPDLWHRFQRHLAGAGKEPGFLQRLSGVPQGTQPGAVLSHLRAVRDHDLLRFDVVSAEIRGYFGIEWKWKSLRRDDLRPWLENWIARIEAAPLGPKGLPEDPGECLLALWAEALFDGDSALARIGDPASLGTDARIAAAHFLGLCPPANRRRVVYRYAVYPDLRVANIASALLANWGSCLPDKAERSVLFHRFRDFLLALPSNPKLPPCPAPLPSPQFDIGNLHLVVANLFPDGCEKDIEALLPHLDSAARAVVVRRLNRYELDKFDRETEKILYGDDPEEWQHWLEDHAGSQSMAQRRLLLSLVNDRATEVAEAAGKAVQGYHLTEEELPLVYPVLKGKSAAKRLLVTRLLARQSDALLRKILPKLLASKTTGERVAALEVLRQLAEQESTAGFAGEILRSTGYRPTTAEETRAFEVLSASFQPAANEDPPGFENAFGLVDPSSLAKPVEPREHVVIIHSPVTLRLIEALDQWAQERADVMIRSHNYTNPDELVRLGDGRIPYAYSNAGETREDVIARFPLAADLAEWWNQRPVELRDPDGFEGARLEFALSRLLGSTDPRQHTMRTVLFGCDKAPVPKSSHSLLENLFAWLKFMVPGVIPSEGFIDYLIDSSETLFVRLPARQKNWASVWGNDRLSKFLWRHAGGATAPRPSLERLWSLLRNRPSNKSIFLHLELTYVLFLLRAGIATEDELIWFLAGPRPFEKYDQERAFHELATATTPPGKYGSILDFPAGQRVVRKVVDRIIDLELTRGEEPEIWSHAALRIYTLYGARHLQRLLTALGKAPLRRPAAARFGKPDLTRNAVLLHLLHVSRPAPEDTPESFTALMRSASIPTDRLLEIALMRPAWTPFIAHATGIEGLRDAVGWIFAHTRSSDYQWESKARELWAGELGFDSPLSAEELIEGAVDTEWFSRAHASVGPEVWETLYAAAKFASTSNGHTRARLFADALLGNVGVAELEKQLTSKGDLNAARAVGLPQLPDADKPRRAELLRRYTILQKLKLTARGSKAQRRASEIAAFETGVRNLARRAGFDDTVRFEWAMECEAVADLSEASLQGKIDDLQCTVVIRPDGTLAMEVCRNGKPLASIPAAAKKQDEFKRLKERMDELKEQASRLRPALESLMVRAVALPVSEWRKILAHPLAGPLVNRLLLGDATGPLGFPSAQGLLGVDGTRREWPSDTTELHLVHPTELLPAETWHAFQRLVFDQRIVQPFKQVFREVYLPTAAESAEAHARSTRFAGHAVHGHQALAILSKRGWIRHPDDGFYRVFRTDGLCAWLDLADETQSGQMTLRDLYFTRFGRAAKSVTQAELPIRVFSEAMRDVDLIVSVAHASGAAPEPGQSTVELRADLIRETCRMLELAQVTIDGRHARIVGALGNYRVHLGSGVVHREPGGMLAMKSDSQPERGRIFLPFADDDPQGIEVLSRVLLFADDSSIRDPVLAGILRKRER